MTRLHREGLGRTRNNGGRLARRGFSLVGSAAHRAPRPRARVERVARRAWEERRRQRQMLASAGARLLRPKLAASVAHWRGAWEDSMRQNRVLSLERIAHGAMAHGASVNEELARRLKKQLEAASAENEAAKSRAETAEAEACRLKELRAREQEAAMGTARQLEMERREEKERRVEHLQRVAARRIGLGAVARVEAWHAAWEERRRQRQMLASAGARLLRPKLAASFGAWRRDWELLARVVKSNAERGRDREIVRQRLALQAEVERLQSNLASCVEEARSERGRMHAKMARRMKEQTLKLVAVEDTARDEAAVDSRGNGSGGSSTCSAWRRGGSASAPSRAGGARGTPRGRSGGDSGRCWRALARGSCGRSRGERRALARGLGRRRVRRSGRGRRPFFRRRRRGSAAAWRRRVERLRAELEAERSGAAAQRRAAAEEAKEQAARQEAAARQLIDRLEEEREKRIAPAPVCGASHGQPGDPSRLDGVG